MHPFSLLFHEAGICVAGVCAVDVVFCPRDRPAYPCGHTEQPDPLFTSSLLMRSGIFCFVGFFIAAISAIGHAGRQAGGDGQVAIAVNQEVKAGEKLAVIEAMKMENILKAEQDCVVSRICANPGESLSVDQIIIEFA